MFANKQRLAEWRREIILEGFADVRRMSKRDSKGR